MFRNSLLALILLTCATQASAQTLFKPVGSVNYSQIDPLTSIKKEISAEDQGTIRNCIQRPKYIFCEDNPLFLEYKKVIKTFDSELEEIISKFDIDKEYTYNSVISHIEAIDKLNNKEYLKYYRANDLMRVYLIKGNIYQASNDFDKVLNSLKIVGYLIDNNFVSNPEVDIRQIRYSIEQVEKYLQEQKKAELWEKARNRYNQGINAVYNNKLGTARNYFRQASNLFNQMGDLSNAQKAQLNVSRINSTCQELSKLSQSEKNSYFRRMVQSNNLGDQFYNLGQMYQSSDYTTPCKR